MCISSALFRQILILNSLKFHPLHLMHIKVMSVINKANESVVGREGEERQTTRSALTGALFRAVFVIGGLVIVFESARNSLTWHLGRLWGSAGDNWQNLWDDLLNVVGIRIRMRS